MMRVRMDMMTMPTLTERWPLATAERHWPPVMTMMTEKPVVVARLRRTGRETM